MSDCLYLNTVKEGHVSKGFQAGASDLVAFHGANILVLTHLAYVIESTVTAMRNLQQPDSKFLESMDPFKLK